MSKLEIGMLAGEARALGLSVPENVPGCAVLEATNVEMKSLTVSEDDSERILLDMNVSCEWRWAAVKVELEL